jgi:hypothetical protein
MADSAESTGTEGAEVEGQEAEQTEGQESAGSADEQRTLTQSEIDAIVEARLARERKKFADYEELKKKAEAHDAAEAEKLTEIERATKEREDALAEIAKLRQERDTEKITSALVAEAVKQGAKNTDAVLRAVDKTEVTVGDDGQVAGAEEAVKSLLAEIPELVGSSSSGTGDAGQGARGSGPSGVTQSQLESMTAEQIASALKEGKLDHLLK